MLNSTNYSGAILADDGAVGNCIELILNYVYKHIRSKYVNSSNAPVRFNGNKSTMFTSSINNTRSITDRIKTCSFGLSFLFAGYVFWVDTHERNTGDWIGTFASILCTALGTSGIFSTISNAPVFEEKHLNPAPK